MRSRAMAFGLLLVVVLPLFGQDAICPKQTSGKTSDDPIVPVVICQQLFPAPPYVRPPADRRAADGTATMYGVVELDLPAMRITAARFYDRDLTPYDLFDASGNPAREETPLMKANMMPSNRVQFLVYEATGKIEDGSTPRSNKRLLLGALRPAILVDGRAIDERFLGTWEGIVSKRFSDNQWYTNFEVAKNFAKTRIVFEPPLTQMDNMGVLNSAPPLKDGTRFKVSGRFENATQPVRLSTGECAPAMNSYGAANPFPASVATTDYAIAFWRFPGMHTKSSADFHVVFDYPKGFPIVNAAMVRSHNFRLKDYIARSTRPEELIFQIHGNPVDQILFTFKPVQGGGGRCTALKE